jgi:AraC-like DNA-binding protein
VTQIDRLATLIDRCSGGDGVHGTAIPRLHLIRVSTPLGPLHSVYEPTVCLIARGSKQVLLGDRVFSYDSSTFLAVSVDVPIVGHIIDPSREEPYLCMRLDLDRHAIAALALEMGPLRDANPDDVGLGISPVTPDLLDAAIRLVKLLETPRDIPILAPLAERELLYRLLAGDQGARLRRIAQADGKVAQVNRAVAWIKAHFRDAFSIDKVAREAGMSTSALHHHFKLVTAMSPLQYQKHLRLQEGRRLLLTRAVDAAVAAHEVGYESPSQFSREYRRMFGAPPQRDVAQLRERIGSSSAAAP